MEEQTDKKRMWRIGIVAPGCIPEMAVDPHAVPDERLVAVAREYSDRAPEGCVVFAFRSRSESFDRRCATLAALVAVHIGKGDFDVRNFICDLGLREAARIEALEADLAVSANSCIELRGKLQDAARRLRGFSLLFGILAALFLALAVAAAWMAFRGKPALQEQSDQRGEDSHQQAVAARGEAGEDPALLAGALLGVEGLEAGVSERAERDAGRNGLEGANNVPPDELCVDERGGDLEDGGVGAVGKIPLAGLGAEDAVFDVVHAGESSTGGDRLSPRAKHGAAQNEVSER